MSRREAVLTTHKYTDTAKIPSALVCHDAELDLEPEMEIDFL